MLCATPTCRGERSRSVGPVRRVARGEARAERSSDHQRAHRSPNGHRGVAAVSARHRLLTVAHAVSTKTPSASVAPAIIVRIRPAERLVIMGGENGKTPDRDGDRREQALASSTGLFYTYSILLVL
jgi:hypothetical protein